MTEWQVKSSFGLTGALSTLRHMGKRGRPPKTAAERIQDKIASKNIRRFRDHSGLSQRDLADLIGLSVDAMAKIERGERGVTLEIATRCAAAFGRPVDHISRPDAPLESADVLFPAFILKVNPKADPDEHLRQEAAAFTDDINARYRASFRRQERPARQQPASSR